MAYSLVTATSAGDQSSGATTPALDTTGASLLVISISYAPEASITVEDSKSNSWTALTASNAGTAVGTRLYYSEPSSVGSGHTFTVSGTDCYAAIAALAFSGSETTPFDQENGGIPGEVTNSLSPGAVTPSANNELLVTCLGYAAANTPTVNASFSIEEAVAKTANYYGLSVAYRVQTDGPAQVTATWDWTGGTACWAASRVATFEAAGEGSPGSPAPGSPAATRGLWRSTILGLGHGGF